MTNKLLSRSSLRLSVLAALLGIASAANATVIDLSGSLTSGVINGATYYYGAQQPTGSGVYDSFVRVSANTNVVQGYNTTVNNVWDTGNTDTFNHEIKVGEVGFLDTSTPADGIGDVMRFFLDINQNSANSPNAGPLLSLDEVQVFISTVANQPVESFTSGGLVSLASSALVYRMDAGSDSHVLLNFDRNTGGSGIDDMTLELTKGMFDTAFTALGLTTNAAKNGAYIYLYSRFGENNLNNDGYEEWSRRTAGLPVDDPDVPGNIPEPGVLLLLGAGLMGMGLARHRKAA